MNNLDETHKRWGKTQYWIYRGQNDARWDLLPSLFRRWESDTDAGYEIELVENFIRQVNAVNIEIPTHSMNFVENLPKHTVRCTDKHIRYDYSHVSFAVAQHSGVPTRLLDFSHSPFIAAWFAADVENLLDGYGLTEERKNKLIWQCMHSLNDDNAIKSHLQQYLREIQTAFEQLPKNIAVWAIRVRDLEHTSLKLLEHPYTQIRRLSAQRGVFLCETEQYEALQQGPKQWKSFNEKLEPLVVTGGIYKLTLPFAEREVLMDLLAQKRISYMYLKPSLESVAEKTVYITPRTRDSADLHT